MKSFCEVDMLCNNVISHDSSSWFGLLEKLSVNVVSLSVLTKQLEFIVKNYLHNIKTLIYISYPENIFNMQLL